MRVYKVKGVYKVIGINAVCNIEFILIRNDTHFLIQSRRKNIFTFSKTLFKTF